ncbi:MAG TPA: ATP-binding protein [Acidimicrobiales bacterium]|nr:ATP-binding protein [Acidimicrobiales bacterium]
MVQRPSGANGARSIHLPPTPRSAARARYFARAVTREWHCDDAVQCIELVTGELAANAVLHAGTDFTLELSLGASVIRIQVDDGSPVIPTPRGYGPDAGTGRGLAVIAASALRWGVRSAPPGKRVWAEIARDGEVPTAPTQPDVMITEMPGRVLPNDLGVGNWSVRFIRVPVESYRQLQQHNDEILRDFALLRMQTENGVDATVPARLVELMEAVRGMFVRQRDQLREQLDRAVARGDELVDLLGWYNHAGIEASARYLDALEEADDFCRSGHLFGTPARPHVAALRRWIVEEMRAQAIDNRPPRPPPAAARPLGS